MNIVRFSSSIIWDIDGVLFKLDPAGKADQLSHNWDSFMVKQVVSEPIEHMVRLARAMSLDHNNIMITSRSEKYRYETLQQLKRHHIPFEALYMRPMGNEDTSPVLKLKLYEKFKKDFEGGVEVTLVVEDREDVADAFTTISIPALLYKGW